MTTKKKFSGDTSPETIKKVRKNIGQWLTEMTGAFGGDHFELEVHLVKVTEGNYRDGGYREDQILYGAPVSHHRFADESDEPTIDDVCLNQLQTMRNQSESEKLALLEKLRIYDEYKRLGGK